MALNYRTKSYNMKLKEKTMTQQDSEIVVLTGAGISAESGLATFRSADGLWNNHKVEDVATVEAFQRNPEYVHEFYNEMKPELLQAKPNPAHLCLTKLQQAFPGKVNIITQNIDTLHEKAGSTNVWHIHGQINQAVCLCKRTFQTVIFKDLVEAGLVTEFLGGFGDPTLNGFRGVSPAAFKPSPQLFDRGRLDEDGHGTVSEYPL